MKIISSCFRSLCFLFFFPIEFLFSIAGIRVFHCHSTISLCVWSDGDSFFFFVYQQIENTILHSLSFSSIFFLFTFLIFIPCVWFFCYVLFGSACFSIHASVFFSVSCFVWSSPVITYSFRTNLFFCHFVALIKDYDQCWFYLNSLLFFLSLAIQCLSFVNASVQLSNDANRRRRRWRWLFTTLFYHRYYQCNCSLLLVAILNDWVSICVN